MNPSKSSLTGPLWIGNPIVKNPYLLDNNPWNFIGNVKPLSSSLIYSCFLMEFGKRAFLWEMRENFSDLIWTCKKWSITDLESIYSGSLKYPIDPQLIFFFSWSLIAKNTILQILGSGCTSSGQILSFFWNFGLRNWGAC